MAEFKEIMSRFNVPAPYGRQTVVWLGARRVTKSGDKEIVRGEIHVPKKASGSWSTTARTILFHSTGKLTTYVDVPEWMDSTDKNFKSSWSHLFVAFEVAARNARFTDCNGHDGGKVVMAKGCDECRHLRVYDGSAHCALGMFEPMDVSGDELKHAIHHGGFLEFNGAIYAQGTLEHNTMETDISSVEMSPDRLWAAIQYCVQEDRSLSREAMSPEIANEIVRLVDSAFPYDEEYNIRQEVADAAVMSTLVEMFPLLEEFILGRDFSDGSPAVTRSWKLRYMGSLRDPKTLARLHLIPDGCIYGENKARHTGTSSTVEWTEGDRGYIRPRPFYENWMPVPPRQSVYQGGAEDRPPRATGGFTPRVTVSPEEKVLVSKCKYVSTLDEETGHIYLHRSFGTIRIG